MVVAQDHDQAGVHRGTLGLEPRSSTILQVAANATPSRPLSLSSQSCKRVAQGTIFTSEHDNVQKFRTLLTRFIGNRQQATWAAEKFDIVCRPMTGSSQDKEYSRQGHYQVEPADSATAKLRLENFALKAAMECGLGMPLSVASAVSILTDYEEVEDGMVLDPNTVTMKISEKTTLHPYQVADVGGLVNRARRFLPMAILGNEAGTGKTYIYLATLAHLSRLRGLEHWNWGLSLVIVPAQVLGDV
jgi:hypothetical protein